MESTLIGNTHAHNQEPTMLKLHVKKLNQLPIKEETVQVENMLTDSVLELVPMEKT